MSAGPGCSVCGIWYAIDRPQPRRFVPVREFGPFFVCESCIQEMALSCDHPWIAADVRTAQAEHRRTELVLERIDGYGEAA
jgi:hypothetical protein